MKTLMYNGFIFTKNTRKAHKIGAQVFNMCKSMDC